MMRPCAHWLIVLHEGDESQCPRHTKNDLPELVDDEGAGEGLFAGMEETRPLRLEHAVGMHICTHKWESLNTRNAGLAIIATHLSGCLIPTSMLQFTHRGKLEAGTDYTQNFIVIASHLW